MCRSFSFGCLLQRMLCHTMCHGGGGRCGLLGLRPRGGMCRTPPTLLHLYSTLVWWLMCKYFQSLHTRSGLRSGLPFPRLVWSWRWQISWDQVWCIVRTRLVCILIYFCPAWSGVVVPANTDIWFYLQQLYSIDYTYLGQWFIMVLNSASACSDVLWFMVSQLLSLYT